MEKFQVIAKLLDNRAVEEAFAKYEKFVHRVTTNQFEGLKFLRNEIETERTKLLLALLNEILEEMP